MAPARLVVALGLALLVGPAAFAQTPPLVQERDVVAFDGMVSDRFTWYDSAGQPRVGVLAHNDGQVGPGGTRGGELRELQYGGRIVRASGSGASGFGYVVSHRGTPGFDNSALGHGFTGQFLRVFEGRHHAIFRFTLLYPRNSAAPANTQYDVPVTIEWVFATGRDHPLWAVTWDLFGVPVNDLMDDSRGPYGELLFDGAANEGAHSLIAGVGWGDRFKFRTTPDAGPVSYNSAWTWNVANTIPYAKLWTTAVDATMGLVQTQTIDQQDAGGYWGTGRWNTTSAPADGGDACAANGEFGGSAAHAMPCSFNWPYQLINYSMGAAIGGNDNDNTNNTRMAWGANYGFLGRATYPTHGNTIYGGPGPDTTASGHPRKSYSTFVVLGLHTLGPVEAQVTQIETVQNTTLTASIGTVMTAGPGGVNRTDLVTYAPAGWNHVRAAWALQAASNRVDANFNVAGTLSNPLVIVSGWTSGLPSAVRFNGAPLVQDVDYFPSLRPDAQELWLTLNRNVAGPVNRLEILPGAAPPGPPFTGGVFVAAGRLDGPAMPAHVITGPGPGRVAEVRAFDAVGGMRINYQVYPSGFQGGVRVTACDVTGDGHDEIVSVAGPGGAPHVRIMQFDALGNFVADLASFFAYDLGFVGGLFIACADIDGDGQPDIILGVDAGGGPHVRILRFLGGVISVIDEFFAYDAGFRGGIRVAAGNVDGSDRASLILGAGPGGGPHLRVLKYLGAPGSWQELVSVMVYDIGFRQGIFVAAGDLTGDGVAEVVTSADAGGGPHVRAFRYDVAAPNGLAQVGEFFAYDAAFRGGVRVAVGAVVGGQPGKILTGAGSGGGAHVGAFDSLGAALNAGFFAY